MPVSKNDGESMKQALEYAESRGAFRYGIAPRTDAEIIFRQQMRNYLDDNLPGFRPTRELDPPEAFNRQARIDAEVAFRNLINENGRLGDDDDLYDGFIAGFIAARNASSWRAYA